MQIIAGRYTVELKELSWWDREEIKAMLVGAAKMGNRDLSGFNGEQVMAANTRAMEKSIVSIKEGETTVAFSMDWLKQLTQSEGDAISAAIEEIGKKKSNS